MSGEYICDYCSSWYTPGDGHACKGTKRTPSEPAGGPQDRKGNYCCQYGSFGDGHTCAKQPDQAAEDEARDAGAIEARELTDDTGVAYEMGWDAAMQFVRKK